MRVAAGRTWDQGLEHMEDKVLRDTLTSQEGSWFILVMALT